MFRRTVILSLVFLASYSFQPLLAAESFAENTLEKSLEEAVKGEGGISVGPGKKGLTVTFFSEALFDSGKAELNAVSKKPLTKVARVMKDKAADYEISIEGHTDNEPIKLSNWKSNWELSAARSISVLHYLEKQGISAKRLSATGYGEHHPLMSNKTEEGRRKNRRVEIILLPKSSEKQKL